MKKWGILISVFVCLVLFFAINCKSPATSETVSPLIAAESESESSSDTGSTTGSGGGGDSSGETTTTFGSLIIKMKDKPVEDAEHVWVTISNIVVHMADPDEFIEVSDVEQPFDLLALKNNPVPIVSYNLEAGHYNQIRMDVVEGSIVFLEDDGLGFFVEVPYNLKIPSNEIKIPVQFYIAENDITEITLDFDAEKSIKVTQQGKKDSYKLRPVIKVVGVSYQ
ncbi:MAG: DUF4382 domain-containing protein [Candidatus Aminicenantaceae bacterium]